MLVCCSVDLLLLLFGKRNKAKKKKKRRRRRRKVRSNEGPGAGSSKSALASPHVDLLPKRSETFSMRQRFAKHALSA